VAQFETTLGLNIAPFKEGINKSTSLVDQFARNSEHTLGRRFRHEFGLLGVGLAIADLIRGRKELAELDTKLEGNLDVMASKWRILWDTIKTGASQAVDSTGQLINLLLTGHTQWDMFGTNAGTPEEQERRIKDMEDDLKKAEARTKRREKLEETVMDARKGGKEDIRRAYGETHRIPADQLASMGGFVGNAPDRSMEIWRKQLEVEVKIEKNTRPITMKDMEGGW
jgi:hypothetical protein